MSTSCTFHLDKVSEIYFGGETISGTIILELPSEQYLKGIHIALKGVGKVSWNEREEKTKSDGTTYTEVVAYSSAEDYVNIRKVLRNEGNIGPGMSTFPFSILLPLTCPSSFEGSYGFIKYELSLVLEKDHRKSFEKILNIRELDDLNLNPTYGIPVQAEEIKSFCCASGNINYSFTVPFGGYVPNQEVHFTLHIQNQSMSDVTGYSISLLQYVTFVARRPIRDTRYDTLELIDETFTTSCLRLSTRIFKGSIKVPSVPPTNQRNSIISISYAMTVTIHVSGSCTTDSQTKIPLHIGTIPLRGSVEPTAPLLTSISQDSDGPPNYQYFKPPSFDEATVSCPLPMEEAPPYESIANASQQPLVGFKILNEKGVNS